MKFPTTIKDFIKQYGIDEVIRQYHNAMEVRRLSKKEKRNGNGKSKRAARRS